MFSVLPVERDSDTSHRMELIAAHAVLPMTHDSTIIPQGAIVVESEKIIDVGTKAALAPRYPQASLTEYPDHILMPGLVNAHCHLDMIDFQERTMVTNDFTPTTPDFVSSLVKSIEYKEKTEPQQIIAGIRKGIGRLIETGTTCLGSIAHFEGTFQLLREAGLRALVYPEVVAGTNEAAQSRFEVALALLEKYSHVNDDRIQVGIAPAAPYLLSRHLLKIISQHAREATLPIQIHAAESFAEMEFFFDSQGPIARALFPALGWTELPPSQLKTPIQYLAAIGFLDAQVTIVGGIHLPDQDFPILARHLTRIAYCPTMNRVMKHGSLPLGKLIDAGIPVGLGTDLWNTRLGFSLWDEMRLALTEGSLPLPSPRDLLQMATIGSARVLGLDHRIGTLEKGKFADFILVHAPEYTSDDECYEKLVTETQPQHVQRVVVNGDTVLKSA
ncbi:MAG: amidohydrolase family protein [Deltaproteobacteria bacterium]|nr:amidohydrolase family protein [Deltaproteobacteria bacterium]